MPYRDPRKKREAAQLRNRNRPSRAGMYLDEPPEDREARLEARRARGRDRDRDRCRERKNRSFPDAPPLVPVVADESWRQSAQAKRVGYVGRLQIQGGFL